MSLSKRKANCVFGCSDLGAYMHRFPHPTRKAELFMSWMSTVGDRLKDIEPDKIFRNKRVCDYHFMPEHKFSSHRLYHYAVPSLHFTGIFPSLITAVQLEHNYCQPRMLLMETRPTENVDISQNEESLDGDEMSQPGQPVTKPPGKSWREINQERKALKRQRNEEKIVKREKRVAIEKEVEEKAKVEAEIEKKYSEISTISIAVPGSILENAQSAELRTYLAGQIARAACVFCVDEVIVYDDIGDKIDTKKSKLDEADGVKVARKSCVQLARILQYLECPQYLRKHFFPLHKDLEFAGLLNPLDAPHHLRQSNDFRFREGITMNKKVKPGKGSQVNVGLLQDVSTDKLLNPGIRVTVRMLPTPEGSKKIKGKIVSLTTPRAETGVYWGYTVRIANNLSQVFTQSPYKKGYDLTIGTSDRGTSIDEIQEKELKYNHALIVFGGLHGIETALESDEQLQVDEASLLFNQYLNVLPNQGSRTIRTEEAILVTLSGLRSKLKANNEPMVFKETTGIASSSIFANQKGDSNQTSAENLIDLSRFD